MKSQNHQTLEFFLSGYRLNDSEQRSNLVTKNFTFTTPVVGQLNFKQLHHYNSVIRSHNEHQIRNITSTDDDNFIVEMDHIIMENSQNYRQHVAVKIDVKFIDHLIDSVTVSYDSTNSDKEIFEKILKPFTDNKTDS